VLKEVECYEPDARVIALCFVRSASIIQFSSTVPHKLGVVVGDLSLKLCHFCQVPAILLLGDADSSRKAASGVPVWPNYATRCELLHFKTKLFLLRELSALFFFFIVLFCEASFMLFLPTEA